MPFKGISHGKMMKHAFMLACNTFKIMIMGPEFKTLGLKSISEPKAFSADISCGLIYYVRHEAFTVENHFRAQARYIIIICISKMTSLI